MPIRGAYRIDDNTGQLWVVSDKGTPRTGARVTVKGTIREGFNLGFAGRSDQAAGDWSGTGAISPRRLDLEHPD
jgi:hypothetical protein